VQHFLTLCQVNPHWILNIKNEESLPSDDNQDLNFTTLVKLSNELPSKIYITFISHCIKNTVFDIISTYIKVNNYDELDVYVTNDII
jgi:hypothetical protein